MPTKTEVLAAIQADPLTSDADKAWFRRVFAPVTRTTKHLPRRDAGARPGPWAIDVYRKRVAANLTQAELAVLVSISRKYISLIEAGKHYPRPAMKARIDAVLKEFA